MNIGPHVLPNNVFVAPMAGVTDRPFRQLCREFGAGHAVSEMVTSRRDLWHTLKTSRRANHDGEPGPIAVQIAGIEAVVAACAAQGVPVTLKMRTGWCQSEKNAVRLARAAESAGVALVTVHGRTREQGYKGEAEYETIAAVKAALRVPVVANGDIDSPHKARAVLQATGADATGGRGAPRAVGAPARSLQPVRCLYRCALGSKAHCLVCPRTARRRRVPQPHAGHRRL